MSPQPNGQYKGRANAQTQDQHCYLKHMPFAFLVYDRVSSTEFAHKVTSLFKTFKDCYVDPTDSNVSLVCSYVL